MSGNEGSSDLGPHHSINKQLRHPQGLKLLLSAILLPQTVKGIKVNYAATTHYIHNIKTKLIDETLGSVQKMLRSDCVYKH